MHPSTYESDTDALIDTDHYPVWASSTIRLKIPVTPKRISATDRNRSERNRKNFRTAFLNHLDEQLELQHLIDEHTLDAAFKSAEQNL